MFTFVMAKVQARVKKQGNRLAEVLAAMLELEFCKATILTRGDASSEFSCGFLFNVDVFCELVTSVGDTVSEGQESIAGAFDSESTCMGFAVSFAVTASVAPFSMDLNKFREEVTF